MLEIFFKQAVNFFSYEKPDLNSNFMLLAFHGIGARTTWHQNE